MVNFKTFREPFPLVGYGKVVIGSGSSDESEYQILNFANIILHGILNKRSYEFAIHNLEYELCKLGIEVDKRMFFSLRHSEDQDEKIFTLNSLMADILLKRPEMQRFINGR